MSGAGASSQEMSHSDGSIKILRRSLLRGEAQQMGHAPPRFTGPTAVPVAIS